MARAARTSRCYRDFVFVKLDRRRPRLRRLLRRGAARDRQPGRPLAGGPAARSTGGVLRNIIHCNWKMYLENINDTVHPMSTHESATQRRRRAVAGPAGRRAQADGDGADPAVRRRLRLLRPHGRPRLSQRPQRARHATSASTPATASCPSTRRRCAQAHGAERAAEILQRSPQNAVLLPEPGGEGLAAGDPRDPPAGRRPHAGRGLELPRRGRARPAVRALADLQPAGVLADVGGRARRRAPVREHPAGPARRRQRMGQPAPRLRPRRARARRRPRRQRHQRAADAQPVPRLGEVHDVRDGGR